MKLKKAKKGSAMIELLFELIIISTLIFGFIVMFPPFITNLKLTFCTKEIVRSIEVSGSVKENEVEEIVDKLLEKNGLNKDNVQNLNISYNPSSIHTCGAHRSSDKKLKMRSSFTVTYEYPITLPIYSPSLKKEDQKQYTMTLKKNLTGISQVYWK